MHSSSYYSTAKESSTNCSRYRYARLTDATCFLNFPVLIHLTSLIHLIFKAQNSTMSSLLTLLPLLFLKKKTSHLPTKLTWFSTGINQQILLTHC